MTPHSQSGCSTKLSYVPFFQGYCTHLPGGSDRIGVQQPRRSIPDLNR